MLEQPLLHLDDPDEAHALRQKYEHARDLERLARSALGRGSRPRSGCRAGCGVLAGAADGDDAAAKQREQQRAALGQGGLLEAGECRVDEGEDGYTELHDGGDEGGRQLDAPHETDRVEEVEEAEPGERPAVLRPWQHAAMPARCERQHERRGDELAREQKGTHLAASASKELLAQHHVPGHHERRSDSRSCA